MFKKQQEMFGESYAELKCNIVWILSEIVEQSNPVLSTSAGRGPSLATRTFSTTVERFWGLNNI